MSADLFSGRDTPEGLIEAENDVDGLEGSAISTRTSLPPNIITDLIESIRMKVGGEDFVDIRKIELIEALARRSAIVRHVLEECKKAGIRLKPVSDRLHPMSGEKDFLGALKDLIAKLELAVALFETKGNNVRAFHNDRGDIVAIASFLKRYGRSDSKARVQIFLRLHKLMQDIEAFIARG